MLDFYDEFYTDIKDDVLMVRDNQSDKGTFKKEGTRRLNLSSN
jgi:hypothetical protein